MTQPIFELSHEECVELLDTEVVGRVAVHTRLGTRIVPVNYSVVDDTIVWRITPNSELATHGPGVEGVFEVDHVDHDLRQGWSVIAYGVLEFVDDLQEVLSIRDADDPAPWAAGLRPMYMRLPYKELTGRRLGDAGRSAGVVRSGRGARRGEASAVRRTLRT